MAPSVPLSRDELLLVAIGFWLVGSAAYLRRHKRVAVIALTITVFTGGITALRWRLDERASGLVRPGSQLRVSPHPAAPVLGDIAPWSTARLERRESSWWLVRAPDGRRGWLPDASVATLGHRAR